MLLLSGFVLANALRVMVGGVAVAHSVAAGCAFAVALGAMVLATGSAPAATWRAVGVGLLGAAVLCLPVVIFQTLDDEPFARPGGSFLAWAAVVGFVAVAEEAFLRGCLYDAWRAWSGEVVAIILTSVCFALLHVPLYGWHVVPLDLAVGLWFAALRKATGGWTAPAVAHTAADFAAWWLR